MGSADQYNPDKAQEVKRQVFERAKEVLLGESGAGEMLLNLAIVTGWAIKVNDKLGEVWEPSVTLSGPTQTRASKELSVDGQEMDVEEEDTTILAVEGLTTRLGFLSVGYGKAGVTRYKVGEEVIKEDFWSYRSSHSVVPGEHDTKGSYVRFSLRHKAREAGCLPPAGQEAEYNAIFEE